MTTLVKQVVPLVLLAVISAPPSSARAQEPAAANQAAQVANDPAKVAEDHLARASEYEARIQELDGVVAEHEQMKRDQHRFFVNPRLTPTPQNKEMEKHCDRIIQDTKKLQGDMRELADWHKARAAELQK
ncbi:MAG: hypothetical protein IPK07_26860 [Deltaproteobacteria bacterium]|nr:hypothetical protein [Deltaproteobacteria bacterium]